MAVPRPARPWYHPMELARRAMYYYLFIFVALYFLQSFLLFPRWVTGAVMSPEKAAETALAYGLMPWKSATGELQGYVLQDFKKPAPRGTIVVFHGNAGWASDRTYYVDAFQSRGFRTFLAEYPGYGGRPGSPSEASIVPRARELICALDRDGYGPVYIWGESVGSGIAASICADPTLPVHGLALLTPWDSLTAVASAHYPIVPVRILLADKYDSIANLARFGHPVCVIAGTKDVVIPLRHAQNLYAHLPEPKKLILHEGAGHNDWPGEASLPWWDTALDFIAPRK